MKNAHRHPSPSTIAAPKVGPSAPATAPAAPQIATARGSWSWAKACITNANDDGISAAAPTAWTMRNTISSSAVGASPHAIEATVNTVEPARKTLPVPDSVSQLPRRDEQRGEHDRVGVQHPGELRRAGVGERRRDVGEGDVEDRRVEERRQDRERRDRQRPTGVRVHAVQLCAVSRVWNDSATTVPSICAMRPCSTARPPVLSWISKQPASHVVVLQGEPAAVDVDREVDAHPAGRRLGTGERGGREAVGGHDQPCGVDRASLERAHIPAEVGAFAVERHPARIEPQLEPSEVHHMSRRRKRHAVRRRRQVERPQARSTRPRIARSSASGGWRSGSDRPGRARRPSS